MLGVMGLGILVGVGVTLLFAPLAGRELRENLGQRIDDATTAADEAIRPLERPYLPGAVARVTAEPGMATEQSVVSTSGHSRIVG